MPDASLLLLLDEVRARTIGILRSVRAEDSLWAPPGLHNMVVWHAGHCYFLLEHLTMRALGRKPQMPREWDQLFCWGSRPQLVSAESWPPLAAIVEQLLQQHTRIRQLIETLTDEQLDQPLAAASDGTVRYAVIHALHDEACHCGEIHLLRKMRLVITKRSSCSPLAES